MKTFLQGILNTRELYFITIGWMCMLTVAGMAQDGQNDFTFNTPDKIATQGTNNTVTASVVLSDDKIVIAGSFTSYNGYTANKLARINVDGKIDKSFNAGEGTDGTINTVAVQPNFKMIIAGDFSLYNGYEVNKIARVNANGSFDKTFRSGVGANNSITKVLIQPDGKIVVAGNFTTYNNKPVKGLVRLNKNGSVDDTFTAALTDSIISIHQIAMCPDGKLIIAGKAKNFFGDLRNYIDVLRLNGDGSRDYGFTECVYSVGDVYPKINSIGIENNGNILLAGTNQDNGSSMPYHGILMRFNTNGEMVKLVPSFWINSMLLQTDGKILALGFDNPEWNIIKRVVVRMNEDLTPDSTFALDDSKVFEDPNECSIQTLAVQNNGKLIVGGNFFELNGLSSGNIARLNTNGSFDDTFNQRKGCTGGVLASVKQADGKLIIGGEFTKFNAIASSNIARLKDDGEVDPSFNVGSGTNGKIYAIAVLPSGKIVIGGNFTSYNGHACSNIARLCANGKFDQSFATTFDGAVRKLTIDKYNNILVGGDFTNVNNMPRNAFVRLSENGVPDMSFQPFIEETGSVFDCKISSDNKIYIALNYRNTPELYIQPKVTCLHSDGTVDDNFEMISDMFTEINAIELTKENKVLAAGMGHYTVPSFFMPKGIVARLDATGDLDT
ncbi:MAG TPA: delta-60 repeat domain-containing protein, partial [Bacteroidia bacterium]|nr:delta-60 repeat domain-containing protein [Bacteroidia bacterium]